MILLFVENATVSTVSSRLNVLERRLGITSGVVLALRRFFECWNNRLRLLRKSPFQRPNCATGYESIGTLKGFDQTGHC